MGDPKKVKTNAERQAAYRKRHPEKTKEYNQRQDVKTKRNEYTIKWTKRMRVAALSGYSDNGTPFCNCCGEASVEFLTIDHVDGGGTKERQSGVIGGTFYKKIVDEGWPAKYQVLCFNCNCAKGIYGECPHKKGIK